MVSEATRSLTSKPNHVGIMANNNIPYSQQLSTLGVSLHHAIIKTLVAEIRTAIADGRIRSLDKKNSIFDFLREILKLKGERKNWERLIYNNPDTVRICHSVKFPRSDGKKANLDSPASDLAGLIYIAYLASCEYSEKFRSASAALFAAEIESGEPRNPIAPAYPGDEFLYSVAQLTEVANYATDSYTRSTIRRDFVENIHYKMVGKEMRLTEKCFGLAITSSRSKKGISRDKCPEIQISVADCIDHHEAKAANKINARLPQRNKYESPGQLSLDLEKCYDIS